MSHSGTFYRNNTKYTYLLIMKRWRRCGEEKKVRYRMTQKKGNF
jgi:hypothetical protein